MLQVYIVTGGVNLSNTPLTSTETLLKEGGTSWQSAADLPSARHEVRGVGLDNGNFLVVGGDYKICCKT